MKFIVLDQYVINPETICFLEPTDYQSCPHTKVYMLNGSTIVIKRSVAETLSFIEEFTEVKKK